MFWKSVWGFEQSGRGHISKGVVGIAAGCLVAVGWTVGVVIVKGRDGGRDASGWAWIDVVSCMAYCVLQDGTGEAEYKYSTDEGVFILGLCGRVRQTGDHGGQVYTAGLVKLQEEVDSWMEYRTSPFGFHGRRVVCLAAGRRFQLAE